MAVAPDAGARKPADAPAEPDEIERVAWLIKVRLDDMLRAIPQRHHASVPQALLQLALERLGGKPGSGSGGA